MAGEDLIVPSPPLGPSDLGLPPAPSAPMLPTVQGPPTEDFRQKLIRLLAVGTAAGLGPGPGTGLLQGMQAAHGQQEAKRAESNKAAQQAYAQQEQQYQFQQRQYETEAVKRQQVVQANLDSLRKIAPTLKNKDAYDEYVNTYSAGLQQQGIRVTPNWLRQAVPYFEPSAKDRANKFMDSWFKDPLNQRMLEQHPDQLPIATVNFDRDGSGHPAPTLVTDIATVAERPFTTINGQFIVYPKGTTPALKATAEGIAQTYLDEDKAAGKTITPALTRQRIEQGIKEAADAKPKNETPDDEAALSLSPAGLDAAALNYAKTGQLPPMGMSKQGGALRSRIINRAAEQYPGLDVAGNKASFASDQAALTQLQKLRESVGAFEKTAGANLDRFIGVARQVADSGSPFLNQPLRSVKRQLLGDQDLAAFEAARLTAQNEIGRVLNTANLNGQLTDSARHEMESALSPNATLPQLLAAAKILRADMQTRRESYDAQIGEIQQRIKGTPGGSAPAAPDTGGDWIDLGGGIKIRKKS